MHAVLSRLGAALAVASLCVGIALAQPAGRGEIAFPTAAAPPAQDAFLTGLAWLHSFEYEQALDSFRAAQAIEPDFGMAYWGEAMCYQQFLWGNEDPAMARLVLARYGATPAERARRAGTPRERAWLASLDTLFGPGERPARLAAYAETMVQIAAAERDNPEATVFHGLALMATASRGLAGAHHAGIQDVPQLAGSEIQERAATLFKAVLRDHPRHPGALHYLIHAYDDPEHAEAALDAARVYATVAPSSSHARHMPAHVFVQLGRWAEAAASDEAAFAASEALVARKGLPPTMKDYHALSWLVYEYLQLGRFRDAERTLERLAVVANESREPSLLSLAATLRARIIVEAEAWDQLPGPDYVNYDELFAIGLSAARRGDLTLAERARQRLAEMSTLERYRTRRPLLQIMSHALSGQLRLAAGDTPGATAVMQEAVDLERALPAAIGPPALIKPAYELLGEMQLARGDAAAAETLFARGLDRSRNRSASVLGRARAAARGGDRAAARRHYTEFLENWRDADADRPEVAEARAFMAAGDPSGIPSERRLLPWLSLALGLGLAAAFVRRRRSRAR